MATNPIYTSIRRLLAAWIAVTGLIAAEHHGTVKFGGIPVPGASVTATKDDKKHVTTTDENGRYAFPDLADGVWRIDIEMMGFAKLSNEIGVAFDSPAAEWTLKFLPLSEIKAPAAAAPAAPPTTSAAAPAATPEKPATTPATPAAAPAAAAAALPPRPRPLQTVRVDSRRHRDAAPRAVVDRAATTDGLP